YVKEGALLPWAAHFGRQCPEPDFAGAAETSRRLLLARGRHIAGHYWWLASLLLLAAGAALWRWRRPSPPPAALGICAARPAAAWRSTCRLRNSTISCQGRVAG